MFLVTNNYIISFWWNGAIRNLNVLNFCNPVYWNCFKIVTKFVQLLYLQIVRLNKHDQAAFINMSINQLYSTILVNSMCKWVNYNNSYSLLDIRHKHVIYPYTQIQTYTHTPNKEISFLVFLHAWLTCIWSDIIACRLH